MAYRNKRTNNEISIIGIPFIDMLTSMVGILIFVLGYIAYQANFKSKEQGVSPLIVYIPNLDGVHIGDNMDIPIGVIGGLEPYTWFKESSSEGCKSYEINDLPLGLELNQQNGRITGKIAARDASNAVNQYCVGVTVKAKGWNDDLAKMKNKLTAEGKTEAIKNYTQQYKILRFKVLSSPLHINRLSDAEAGKLYKQDIGVDKDKNLFFIDLSFTDEENLQHEFESPTLNDSILEWKPNLPGLLKFRLASKKNEQFVFLSDEFEIVAKPPQIIYKKPEIVDLQLPIAYRLRPYTTAFSVKYGQPPFSWEVLGLPSSFTLDKSTGIISGIFNEKIENNTNIQEIDLDVSVTDQKNEKASIKRKLIVNERTKEIPKLVIKTTQEDFDRVQQQAGKYFELSLAYEGGDNQNVLWETHLSSNDLGLFVENKNRIKGTPKFIENITVQAKVSDGVDNDEKVFNIKIKPSELELNVPKEFNGVIARNMTFSAKVSGGIPPYEWSNINNLPSGLFFTKSLKKSISEMDIGGDPESSGEAIIHFKVKDSNGSNVDGETKINIAEALKITTETLVNGTINKLYSEKLRAVGGIPPYQWDLLSKQKQNEWLSITKDGELSGIPLNIKSSNILVRVTDNKQISTEKKFELIIDNVKDRPKPTEQAPSVDKEADTKIVDDWENCEIDNSNMCRFFPIYRGESYNTIMKLGKEELNSVVVSEGKLPRGVRVVMSNDSLVFEGEPKEVGDFSFTIKLNDKKLKKFKMSVNDIPGIWEYIKLKLDAYWNES